MSDKDKTMGGVKDQMTNPSLEYMRRIRREEQDKLLGLRRERAAKALRSLDLHGGSHAMLSQIAYAVYPHVGAWDAESCDHLRNVLTELIGDAREAASGVESHSPCGASGCHCGNESEEVSDGMAGGGRGMREDSGDSACGRMDGGDFHQEVVGYPSAQYDVLGNERHKAVCELRKLGKCSPLAHNFRDALAAAVAVPKDGAPYDDGELCHLICDRLIHLLGGDQSDDPSPMRQENETENPRMEQYVLEHPRMICEPDGITITNGEHEVKIVKDDVKIDGISVVGALNEVASGRLPDFARSKPYTSVTKELREWAKKFRHTWINVVDGMIMHTTADFAPDIDSMKVSDYITGIADRIDARVAEMGA